jgi:hypothetical protein
MNRATVNPLSGLIRNSSVSKSNPLRAAMNAATKRNRSASYDKGIMSLNNHISELKDDIQIIQNVILPKLPNSSAERVERLRQIDELQKKIRDKQHELKSLIVARNMSGGKTRRGRRASRTKGKGKSNRR